MEGGTLDFKVKPEPVSAIGKAPFVRKFDKKIFKKNKDDKKSKCFSCGCDYPHDEGKSCPAKDKKCNQCGKIGHFASCCKGNKSTQKRSGEIKSVETEPDFASIRRQNSKYLFTIGQSRNDCDRPVIKI